MLKYIMDSCFLGAKQYARVCISFSLTSKNITAQVPNDHYLGIYLGVALDSTYLCR